MGDVKGISLPAVINEVISVTGVYSFPFQLTPSTAPIDTPTGVIPNKLGPILLFGNSLTIGGTASSSTTGGTGGTGTGGTGTTTASGNVNLLAAADFNIWVDRIPGAVNRNVQTDFAAPAFNVPTFSRVFLASATSSSSTTGTGGAGGGRGGAGGGARRRRRRHDRRRFRLEPAGVLGGGHVDVVVHRHRFVRPGLLGAELLDRPGPVQRRHVRRVPQHAGRAPIP